MKAPGRSRSPAALAALALASLGAAGVLGWAGYQKLTGAPGEVALFTGLGMEPGGRHLIGVLELGAAFLILVPQSAVYGAILGLGIMCGAAIGHLTAIGLAGLHLAVVVAACCTTVIVLRRDEAGFIRHLWDR